MIQNRKNHIKNQFKFSFKNVSFCFFVIFVSPTFGSNVSKTVLLEQLDLMAAKQLAEFRRFCNKFSKAVCKQVGVLGCVMHFANNQTGSFRISTDLLIDKFQKHGYKGDVEYVLRGLQAVGEKHITGKTKFYFFEKQKHKIIFL